MYIFGMECQRTLGIPKMRILKIRYFIRLFLLVQIFSVFVSSIQCLNSNRSEEVSSILSLTELINVMDNDIEKPEVPVQFVREYGFYFLRDKGYRSLPFYCEIEGINLQIEYEKLATELTKVVSLIFLDFKVFNSITSTVYSDMIARLIDIEKTDLNIDFFVKIFDQKEQLRTYRDSFINQFSILENLSTDIDNSINNLQRISSLIKGMNVQMEDEIFCKNLYEFKMYNLMQFMLVFKGLLLSVQAKDTSGLLNQLVGSEYKELFQLLLSDATYLSTHLLSISNVNLKMEASLSDCINSLVNFELPLFGGSDPKNSASNLLPKLFKSSFGVKEDARSALKFGLALDELARNGDFLIKLCKSSIREFLSYMKSQQKLLLDKLGISKVILQKLKMIPVMKEILFSQYSLFKEYILSKDNADRISFIQLGNLIKNESVYNLVVLISEIQTQLQEMLQNFGNLFGLYPVNMYPKLLWDNDSTFPLSILVRDYKFEQRFSELSRILDIIIESTKRLKKMENKTIRFLNFNIFSKLLLLLKPSEKEVVQNFATRMHKYVKFKNIYNSYLINVPEMMKQGYNLEKDTSEFLDNYFSGSKDPIDKSICTEIKTYFGSIPYQEVKNLIELVDRKVSEAVFNYRREYATLNDNVDSLDTLLSLNFGFSDQYRGIQNFISRLMYHDSIFEIYISNYLEMRNCLEKLEYKYSLVADYNRVNFGETVNYRLALNFVKTGEELKSAKDIFLNIDVKEINEIILSIESTLEMNFLAQIYLIGSIKQAFSSKSDIQKVLTKDDLNFVYDSIVTNNNIIFQRKGTRPVIIDKTDFKGRLNYLYTLFSSYSTQLDTIKSLLIREKNKYFNEKLNGYSPLDFISIIDRAIKDLFSSIVDMLENNFLTKNIEQEVLEALDILYNGLTPECYYILKRFKRMAFLLSDIILKLTNGGPLEQVKQFIYSAIDKSIFESDAIELLADNNLNPIFLTGLSPNDYPGSILLNKNQIQSSKTNPDTNCRVAYIDLDKDLFALTYLDSHATKKNLYNVVTIHCDIRNSPGETLNDFLMKRSTIKETGVIALHENIVKFLADKVYINYLAVDYKLANSNLFIETLEMELNQYFILIPELKVDYFINLDILLFSSPAKHFEIHKELITACLDMYLYLDSTSNGFSRSFLNNSNYLKLLYPTDKNGNSVKLLSVGKYSGFGGETPISISFIKDHLKSDSNSYIDNIAMDLFQKSALNYVKVYLNLAPLKSSLGRNKEYIWLADRKSHICYMMLLRNELINDSIRRGQQNGLLYVGSFDRADQEQISMMNIFFNSIVQREIMSSMFYDVTKNKVFVLVDKDLTFTISSSINEILSIKLGIHKYFFENMEMIETKILEVPVYEVEMRQAIDSYVSDSLPRFCSSRRNYYDNSIVLSITDDFTIKDVLSYRLLLKILNSFMKLRVRNLPSQDALRYIYNIGEDYILDIDNLKYSYISPLKDLNDRQLLSAIQRDASFALRRSVLYSSCTQLSRFTPDISLNSLGFSLVLPEKNNKLHINKGDEIFNMNGITYLIIRYSINTLINSLSRYLGELLKGRVNILLLENNVDISQMKQEELPTGNSSFELHLLKGIPIELVKKEHLIRIYVENYVNEDLQLIHNIMKIYRGYNVSILTKMGELYYSNKMCFDNSNIPKSCTYINVFRYLNSNLFEQLTLYQMALNLNLSLSVIVQDGELISNDMIGLNVISRFGGSVLFRSEDVLELYYYSEQYWDVCSFVQEYYKSSTELPIKLVNFDPEISDVVFKISEAECPLPPIPNLNKRNSLHHFVKLQHAHEQNPITQSYIFTLYRSIRYQTLAVYLQLYTLQSDLSIRMEGSDILMTSQSIKDILNFFFIEVLQDDNVRIELKDISFRDTEIESARMVANKLRSIIPDVQITGYNPRGEVIIL